MLTGSWKTTSMGILAILGGAFRIYMAIKSGTFSEEAFMTSATAILTGIGLLFARDNNVTSEDVNAITKSKVSETSDTTAKQG